MGVWSFNPWVLRFWWQAQVPLIRIYETSNFHLGFSNDKNPQQGLSPKLLKIKLFNMENKHTTKIWNLYTYIYKFVGTYNSKFSNKLAYLVNQILQWMEDSPPPSRAVTMPSF